MKIIKLLAAAFLVTLTISAFANTTKDENTSKRISKEIAGNPEDINVKEIEALKKLGSTAAAYPVIVLPKADDFNSADIEKLRGIGKTVSLPELTVNSSDDINHNDIEALKML